MASIKQLIKMANDEENSNLVTAYSSLATATILYELNKNKLKKMKGMI